MKIRIRNPHYIEVNMQLHETARKAGQEIEVKSVPYNERWSEHDITCPDDSDKDCATILFFTFFMEDHGYEYFDFAFVL